MMIGQLDHKDASELIGHIAASAERLGHDGPDASKILAWCTYVALMQSALELVRRGELLIGAADSEGQKAQPRFYDAESRIEIRFELRPPLDDGRAVTLN